MEGITLRAPAKPVGYWELPGASEGYSIRYSAWKKPRWLTRKMMYYVFEWKWIEA